MFGEDVTYDDFRQFMVAEEDEMQDKFCKTLVEVGLLEEPKEEEWVLKSALQTIGKNENYKKYNVWISLGLFLDTIIPSQKEHSELKFWIDTQYWIN